MCGGCDSAWYGRKGKGPGAVLFLASAAFKANNMLEARIQGDGRGHRGGRTLRPRRKRSSFARFSATYWFRTSCCA
eukprot:7302644-Prorocentrum_lima.AAC.1